MTKKISDGMSLVISTPPPGVCYDIDDRVCRGLDPQARDHFISQESCAAKLIDVQATKERFVANSRGSRVATATVTTLTLGGIGINIGYWVHPLAGVAVALLAMWLGHRRLHQEPASFEASLATALGQLKERNIYCF